MEPDTGIETEDRADIAKRLGHILDATYSLMVRSHLYHWNVRGPLFEPLHELLEGHYKALFEAVDEIAERIRQLGFRAPSSDADPFPSGVSKRHEMSARAMVEDLLGQHEASCRMLRETGIAADDAADLVTADMIAKMLGFHEKAAWMLRATLVAGGSRASGEAERNNSRDVALPRVDSASGATARHPDNERIDQ